MTIYDNKDEGLNTEYKKLDSHLPVIIKISFLVVILMVLASAFFIFNSSINEKMLNEIEQHEKNIRWEKLELLINENIKLARSSAKLTSSELTTSLNYQYKDQMDDLRNQIINPDPDSPVIKTFKDNIDNKYFSGIQSFNNTQFIMTKNFILADNNIHRRYEDRVRDISREIKLYDNSTLSKLAFDRLRNKEARFDLGPIYLEANGSQYFLKNNNMTMKDIRNVYFEYGIEGLKNIRFLVPSYILEDKDIFGVADSDMFGLELENNKIIVVQRFNIVDVINEHHNYQYFDEPLNSVFYSEIKKHIQINQLFLRVTLVASVLILLAAFLQLNNFINNRKKIIEKSFNHKLNNYDK